VVITEALPDAEVITASLTDPERFTTLYQRYAGEIHRYVAGRLGPDTADDLVAETLLEAFRHRDDSRLELILDPRTYRYLGLRDVLTRGHGGAEEVTYWAARLSAQPVARPGERP
jgi:RNA polymerase sigma-70 factor (ECF subfamily)